MLCWIIFSIQAYPHHRFFANQIDEIHNLLLLLLLNEWVIDKNRGKISSHNYLGEALRLNKQSNDVSSSPCLFINTTSKLEAARKYAEMTKRLCNFGIKRINNQDDDAGLSWVVKSGPSDSTDPAGKLFTFPLNRTQSPFARSLLFLFLLLSSANVSQYNCFNYDNSSSSGTTQRHFDVAKKHQLRSRCLTVRSLSQLVVRSVIIFVFLYKKCFRLDLLLLTTMHVCLACFVCCCCCCRFQLRRIRIFIASFFSFLLIELNTRTLLWLPKWFMNVLLVFMCCNHVF